MDRSSTQARRPDFFIVGAFKSGTTALYDYLRQHPQVFMPFHKEPLFFGDDLTRRYGRMTLDQYLSLFKDAGEGQRVGEASAWYLYSHCAANEIREFRPDAQIIVMLRNPVDVMHAQHSQMLFNAAEDIPDFGGALEAEPMRRRGERLPSGPIRIETLFYRQSVRFAEQVERYYDTFGRDRIHIILYDEFRDRTAEVYQSTLRFLGVDPSFTPQLAVVNANRRVRSSVLQRLIFQPPRTLLGAVRLLRRFPMVHRARSALLELNSRARHRAEMDPQLRAQLIEEFAPEVRKLASLIDRDLAAWLPAGVE
ncbi:MAG: sulfotransferase [Chloroflexota bacterium]